MYHPTENIQHYKETSNTTEEVEQYFPGLLSFTDGTEQQIQSRPEDKRRRKEYYSLGKKKIHTAVKNQPVVNKNGYIIHKLGHKKGRRHDYYI